MTGYICLALLIYIIVQDLLNRNERKRLTDAFLAKDLTELKEYEKKTEDIKAPLLPDEMNIDNVSQEVFDLAIKKELGREPVVEKVKTRLKNIVRGKHGR